MFSFCYLFDQYIGIVGITVIFFIAFLFSFNRKKVLFRPVFTALFMQFLLAFFILKTTLGAQLFNTCAEAFRLIYQFADSGVTFLFGSLAQVDGPVGFIFAVKVLPMIIFFGALMSLLFHVGVIQVLVRGIAFFIRPVLGSSGAETLSVAASSMLGQTEAPLLIKSYLPTLTKSETLTVMVSGMAHLSGAILAGYGLMGISVKHMIAASFMAIPGTIAISKILLPETDAPVTLTNKKIEIPKTTKNFLDAISLGTIDGLKLSANIGAMLISFISLIALADYALGSITKYMFSYSITLNTVFGGIFYPIVYLIGIPKSECLVAGSLMGQKVAINEFIAYSALTKAIISERSKILLTYALAGFANFSSIGIQIGGIGSLCSEKRMLLTQLGFKALLGGTLINLLNAAIVSMFL